MMEGLDMNNYGVPYGYPQQSPQPPQYQQYPYDPRIEKLQSLDARMKEMEGRLYGNSNNWQAPQSYPNNGSGGNTQSNSQASPIITVQSEEDAFKDPPNIDGSKQIYTDGKGGGLPTYAKWFDANIPKTFRKKAIWVDIGEETTEQQTAPSVESDITPAITALSDRLTEMEESISDMLDKFDKIVEFVLKSPTSAKKTKTTKKEESENDK